MSKNNIFTDKTSIDIVSALKTHLDEHKYTCANHNQDSTRSSGDGYEDIIKDIWPNLDNKILSYAKAKTRRSMEDLSFNDKYDNKYFVDVKTHRLDTEFNMPNITSVKRLLDFYANDNNFFCLLMVSYSVENDDHSVKEIIFHPIENLSWECLTFGALGWGQIQISDSNNIQIEKNITRIQWMETFKDKVRSFYDTEIDKIKKRKKVFE